MMDVSITVDADELRRALRYLGDAGLKKELREANKSAAAVVVDAALPNVPVLTGRLRRSVRATGSQRGASVKAGNVGVPYAAAIHWGRKRGGVIKARPFLWNAAEASQHRVLSVFDRAMDRLLDKLRRL